MESFEISKLSKEELDRLLRASNAATDRLKFFVYKIGTCCNATKSVSFLSANCDLQLQSVLHDIPTGMKNCAMHMEFSILYEKGFDILGKLLAGTAKSEDFDKPSNKALQTLITFIKSIESHEKSLARVLKEIDDLTKTDVLIAMAEHLIGKLCRRESFFIDSKSKGKYICRCGCNADIKSGGTGLETIDEVMIKLQVARSEYLTGNEHVWHGFLDVMFESNGDISNGACVIFKSHREIPSGANSDEERGEEDYVAEVKPSTSPGGFTNALENQIAAQSIVFSILQKNRHPQMDNFLIPFIAISASHVIIFMYDAEYDILMRCQELPIFSETQTDSLDLVTIITLWMILNYKYFCSGIDLGDLSVSLEDAQSGFTKHIAAYSKNYELIKSGVSSFPAVEREEMDIDDPFIFSSSICMRNSTFLPFPEYY